MNNKYTKFNDEIIIRILRQIDYYDRYIQNNSMNNNKNIDLSIIQIEIYKNQSMKNHIQEFIKQEIKNQ